MSRNDYSDLVEYIKLLSEDAILPVKGTSYAACNDLFSPIDCVIPAGRNLLIKTDVAIAWSNPSYYLQILSRSGLCYKYNVNCQAGVIDYDYRKNIGVILHNNSDTDFIVKRGDRIAQYTYIKIANVTREVITDDFFPIESNRDGGYGSSGR